MLKLNASYSKKVPVEGQRFSSQNFHAAVEVELPDGLTPEQLKGRIHDTFVLVRDSVEAELHSAPAATTSQPYQQPQQQGQPRKGQPIPVASVKQLGYLRNIALKQGMTPQQLDMDVNRRFGLPNAEALNKKQASALIDEFNNGGFQQAA